VAHGSWYHISEWGLYLRVIWPLWYSHFSTYSAVDVGIPGSNPKIHSDGTTAVYGRNALPHSPCITLGNVSRSVSVSTTVLLLCMVCHPPVNSDILHSQHKLSVIPPSQLSLWDLFSGNFNCNHPSQFGVCLLTIGHSVLSWNVLKTPTVAFPNHIIFWDPTVLCLIMFKLPSNLLCSFWAHIILKVCFYDCLKGNYWRGVTSGSFVSQIDLTEWHRRSTLVFLCCHLLITLGLILNLTINGMIDAL